MKKSILLTILSLFALAACTGFETDQVSGQFIAKEDRLSFKTANGVVDLYEGEVDLQFNTGLIGVYDPSITIVQNGVEVGELKVPRAAFANNNVKISAAELKQDFGLEAKLSKVVIKTWRERNENASCDYYGYCYGCTLKTNANGDLENDCDTQIATIAMGFAGKNVNTKSSLNNLIFAL